MHHKTEHGGVNQPVGVKKTEVGYHLQAEMHQIDSGF